MVLSSPFGSVAPWLAAWTLVSLHPALALGAVIPFGRVCRLSPKAGLAHAKLKNFNHDPNMKKREQSPSVPAGQIRPAKQMPVWPNNSSVTFFIRFFWLCFKPFASLISRYSLEKAPGLGHWTN